MHLDQNLAFDPALSLACLPIRCFLSPPTSKHTKKTAARTIRPQSSLPFVGHTGAPKLPHGGFLRVVGAGSPEHAGHGSAAGSGGARLTVRFPRKQQNASPVFPQPSDLPKLSFPAGHTVTAEKEGPRREVEMLPRWICG